MARIWAFSLGLLLVASTVHAQDDAAKNAAREFAEQGAQAMQKGDYDAAQDLFGRAYALVPAPTIAYRRGQAFEKLGRWVEAIEAYVRATRTPLGPDASVAFRDAVQKSNEAIAALRPRVPKLKIVVKGIEPKDPSVKLTIDGKPASSALIGAAGPVDPGKHDISIVTADGRHGSNSVELAEKEEKSIEVELAPGAPLSEGAAEAPNVSRTEADSQSSSSQRTWAIVSLGVGAVGLGVGIGAGLVATSKHKSAEDACPDGKCEPGSAGADDVDAFRRYRTISTIGYVVGAVGVGAGVTLWLTAPKREKSTARLGAFVGPSSTGIRGSF